MNCPSCGSGGMRPVFDRDMWRCDECSNWISGVGAFRQTMSTKWVEREVGNKFYWSNTKQAYCPVCRDSFLYQDDPDDGESILMPCGHAFVIGLGSGLVTVSEEPPE